MRWCGIAFCIPLCCLGCVREQRPRAEQGPVGNRWIPGRMTHVRVEQTPLGSAPNSGVMLPAVSPDGRWIAYLDLHGEQQVDLESLFTGPGLEAMSLRIRPLRGGGPERTVCKGGAVWPAWSPDSRRLVFVAYGDANRCDLGIYEVDTGHVRRIATGVPHIVTPTVSPRSQSVAFVVPQTGATPPRLHVLTLTDRKLRPCPIGEASERHYWPHWTADGRIVYVLARNGRTWIAQWGPGSFPPETMYEINVRASRMGAYQAFAGLGRPLSPDDRRFAYYDHSAGRIVLVSLRDGKRVALKEGTRFGCWLDARRFVGATDDEMSVFAGGKGAARLMKGRWLPRGTAAGTNELILCAPGVHRAQFSLVRMKVIAAE